MNVRPRIGRREAAAARPAACLNCGAGLTGDYCSSCGQKALIPRSLTAFLTDFVSGLMNFEGKFWRTLPMLAWCPGDLTRRYVDGQRVRFISPVGLYLFTVFLMFATLGLTGALGDIRFDGSLDKTINEERLKLDRVEKERARVAASGGDTAPFDKQIAEARSDLEDLRKLENGEVPAKVEGLEGAPGWVREGVTRAAANPRESMTKVQQAASTYSWLLIPLSVPVLRLLFPLRRRKLYDHTVFVTYSLSFMMLLVIVGGALAYVGLSSMIPWLFLVPPWHMYRQLKGAYGLSRAGAIFRATLLSLAAMIVLTIWGIVVIALGALF